MLVTSEYLLLIFIIKVVVARMWISIFTLQLYVKFFKHFLFVLLLVYLVDLSYQR